MARTKYHIISPLIILGLLSLIMMGSTSYSSTQFGPESELVELCDASEGVDGVEESLIPDSDDTGHGVAFVENTFFNNDLLGSAATQTSSKQRFAAKAHLFILYCCLKLDCFTGHLL